MFAAETVMPEEEPEGLKVPSESSEESTSASVLAEAFGEAEDGALIMACPCSLRDWFLRSPDRGRKQ